MTHPVYCCVNPELTLRDPATQVCYSIRNAHSTQRRLMLTYRRCYITDVELESHAKISSCRSARRTSGSFVRFGYSLQVVTTLRFTDDRARHVLDTPFVARFYSRTLRARKAQPVDPEGMLCEKGIAYLSDTTSSAVPMEAAYLRCFCHL